MKVKEFYNSKLVYTKTLSIRRLDGKLVLVSNYTGAIEPLTLKGLVQHLKDFRLKYEDWRNIK